MKKTYVFIWCILKLCGGYALNAQDSVPSTIPKISAVTVDLTDSLNHILWNPSSDVNVTGYTVFRKDNGMYVPIDVLYGRHNTEYVDKGRDPYREISYYRISALDTTPVMSSPQSNFQLNRIDFYVDSETCEASYSLFWTPYDSSCNSLSNKFQYQIWVSQNNAPLIQIGEVPCSALSFSDNVRGFQNGSTYTFVVKAVNSIEAAAAYSTKCSFVFRQEVSEDTVYIRYVTVHAETEIEVAVHADFRLLPETIELYRSDYGTNNYVKIAAKNAVNSSNYLFSDKNVSPNLQRYEYQAVLINPCGNVSARSNIASNILLQGNHSTEAEIGLNWTSYTGFDDDVESYTVFRKVENLDLFQEIDRRNDLSYLESVWNLATTGNKFAYYIEAVENDNNKYGFKEISRSNTVCLEESAILFIPNAFYPSGQHNAVFKPSNLFITTTGYMMKIFNRTGALVFSTTDPNTGWDGRTDGKKNPLGVYIYLIEFIDKNEEFKQYQGIVTLVE